MPQTATLLRTKLFIARPQGHLIRRERLVRMLDIIPRRRLTLLSAPAGFGKTTLLGEWIEERGFRTAWFSVDSGDNDLKRFLTYIVGAIRTLHEDIGRPLLEGLEVTPTPPIERLLTTLINEIAALPDPFLLVLDDYHRIENQAIHDAMLFLLEHAPAQLHIVLTTRVDPSLPLSRFRVRGEMLEIRATDLRFSDEETAGLFNEQLQIDLSPEHLEALQRRTEGWIAGLKMAALSMEGRSDIETFIEDFTGADRYVLDYLIEEVINRQTPELQAMMLELSVLDRITGDLCEAVTGCENGAGLLEQLERANLFLIPLDNQRIWYRYHHLFSELLQHRLQQANPDLIPELHRRAAEWFEENDLLGEALHHARSSGSIALLAEMMDRHWQDVLQLSQDGVTPLEEFVVLLPAEVIAGSVHLSMLNAWLHVYPGRRFGIVQESLDTAERLTAERKGDDAMVVTGQIALLRAVMARDRGDAATAIEYGEQARQQLLRQQSAVEPGRWNMSQSLISKVLGAAYAFAGKARKATDLMEEALAYDRQSGNSYYVEMSLANLSRQYGLQGELNNTDRSCDELIALMERPGEVDDFSDRSIPWLLRTRVRFERGEYADALAAARESLRIIKANNANMEVVLRQQIVLICDAMNAQEPARRELAALEMVTLPEYEVRLKAVAPTLHAILALRSGDLATAKEWGERFFNEDDPTFTPRTDEFAERTYYHVRWEQLTYARLLIARERYDQANALLTMLREEFDREGVLRMLMEAIVLQAVVAERKREKESAADHIATALQRGEADGYIRPFAYDSVDVAPILARMQRGGLKGVRVGGEYLSRVVAACGIAEGMTVPPQPQNGWGVPGESIQLTSREMEILQLMSLGYSNQKIADKLYVSINTIKTHASNLFSKLEARNRVDALVRAREAGLLG